MSATYVPTRFYSLSYAEDGTMVLHNSRTGAIGAVPAEDAQLARESLRRSAKHEGPLEGILKDLYEGGFLIPEGTDENDLVHRQYLSKYETGYLSLIILPTEQCNFRCVYCYESFLRGAMSADIRNGIKKFVEKQKNLKHLEIHWFGGEPFLASDVVLELSEWFQEYSTARGINYGGGATTNGSLLTPEIAEAAIRFGVNRYQVTIDGLKEDHNARRVLQGEGDGFEMSMANLRYLKSTDHLFLVTLRHNFDPENSQHLEPFIQMLAQEFGNDPRFATAFEAIGQWGGANDSNLSVCDSRTTVNEFIRARELSLNAGFRGTFQLELFQPSRMGCYAADPRTFVIGSDGRIYKCTVELDYHERNIVGRLHPDGNMELDWRKMSLWVETNGRREGTKCTSCFFGPVCHGAVCPKDWMDSSDCDCPPAKKGIKKVLPLLLRESELPPNPDMLALLQCSRDS